MVFVALNMTLLLVLLKYILGFISFQQTVDVVYREPHPLFGREERRPLAEEVADLV